MASGSFPSTTKEGLVKGHSQPLHLLTMLAHKHPSDDRFLLRRPDGSLYAARDICFADNLQYFESALEDLQLIADIVSTYVMIINLSIGSHKLRAFHFGELALLTVDSR